MVDFMEHPTKMDDDWGYPHLWKPPYNHGTKEQLVFLLLRPATPSFPWRALDLRTFGVWLLIIPSRTKKSMGSHIAIMSFLAKIEGPVWYTIYHPLPVVKGVTNPFY